MNKNPFPGPQPYRAADRARFFARDVLVKKLANQVLARSATTVFGPSGAGKSSLMQAGVIPALEDSDDVRVVRVDAWPPNELPLPWLVGSMNSDLELEMVSEEKTALEMLESVIDLAAERSDRAIVIYLDQIEQLFVADHAAEDMQSLLQGLTFLSHPDRQQEVHIVLSLREDYLGRLRDWTRERPELSAHGFRVAPLSVGEMVKAMRRTAKESEPPQEWDDREIRKLMLDVRVPGQTATDVAEVQTAFGQIVCRALWEERAAGQTARVDEANAEAILQRYLDTTLTGLGSLQGLAQQLLEEHLIDDEGHRRLLTEKEARLVLRSNDAIAVLDKLEAARILRAEEHQGSRYFELGHDWLARKVFDERAERERLAEQTRVENEQALQLSRARAQQSRFLRIAVGAVAIALLVTAAAVVALIARSRALAAEKVAENARIDAVASEEKATRERDEANDLRVMAGYLALQSQGNASTAMQLLAEVIKPEERGDWVEYANTALEKNALFVTLRGHRAGLCNATFSPDGKYVLTASDDHTARIWNADGTGQAIVLVGHEGALTSAEFAPESKADFLRVLTTSADGTARIFSVRGTDVTSVVLSGKTTDVMSGAWSPDGQHVAVASMTMNSADPSQPAEELFAVRVHSADDGSLVGEMTKHQARITALVFLDNTHVVSASEDKTVRVWEGTTNGNVTEVPGHTAPVTFVTVNRARKLLVTTSADAKARVFKIDANAILTLHATLAGHTRPVLHAAISDDGKFVATGSEDRTARVWSIESSPAKGQEVILDKHTGSVHYVAFRPGNANMLATASADWSARVFRLNSTTEPFVLTDHDAEVKSIAWNPSGDHIVTAAFGTNQRDSADHTAKIYDNRVLEEAAPWTLDRHFHSAALGATGESFAAAYDDTSIRLFAKGEKTKPITIQAPATESWGLVSALATTQDGGRLALASLGKDAFAETPQASANALAKGIRALHVYEKARHDQPVKQYEVESVIRYLAWDTAGQSVVAALENTTAMVFRPSDNSAPTVLRGHTNWLTSASFSHDGQKIVTTSLDGNALVFDTRGNGTAVGRFHHPKAVYAAAFDPTGQRIATACTDGKVRIFALSQTAVITEFDAQMGDLRDLAWSADGSRLAAASLSGRIVVWSPLTWPLTRQPRVFVLQAGAPVLAIGFGDGNATLIAATAGRTRAWELETSQIMGDLRTRTRDCISLENRSLYLKETLDLAKERFVSCEKAQGRVVSTESALPANSADGVVVRIVVWPHSAEVQVDGIAMPQRDPFVEIWGNAGDKKRVRVVDGAWSTEVDVMLDASGAKPAVIDLEAIKNSKTNAKRGKRPGDGLDVFINPDRPDF